MKKLHPFRPGKWAVWMVVKDIKNYRDWIKTINKEKANPKSKWYEFKLSHNDFYILYLMVTLAEEDRVLPDNIKRLRLIESLAPVNRYIDEDLGFAEYIIPEFNQFFDTENNPTLTYGIVYRYAFKRLSLTWVISRSIIVGLLIFLFVRFPIISTLIGWISNLM
jgi:hypothetical protein